MFDTMQVGKRIRNARIAKNLTQTEVADAMGVSYQAVSNWERGNSMPDIAKLPELCKLLDVPFETLIGGETKEAEAVKKAAKGESITMEEAAEIAPLLPPEELKRTVEQERKEHRKPDIKLLIPLAPFMSEEDLDALAAELIESEQAKKVIALAPFLSHETLDGIVRREKDADFSLVVALAAFLSHETLDGIVQDEKDTDFSRVVALAPFLSHETLDKLADALIETEDAKKLTALAPFLSHESIKKIVDRLVMHRDYKGASRFMPFL